MFSLTRKTPLLPSPIQLFLLCFFQARIYRCMRGVNLPNGDPLRGPAPLRPGHVERSLRLQHVQRLLGRRHRQRVLELEQPFQRVVLPHRTLRKGQGRKLGRIQRTGAQRSF